MGTDTKLPDFDTLSRLYQEDPGAFESFRRQLLRQAVDEEPRRHRLALEELLLCIEANRQRAASPAEAASNEIISWPPPRLSRRVLSHSSARKWVNAVRR